MTANCTFRNLVKQITFIRDDYFTQYHINTPCSYSYSHGVNSIKINRTLIAFEQLDPLDRMIINNEFFYQDYDDWWKKYFSRATFYRLKRKAMEAFMNKYES